MIAGRIDTSRLLTLLFLYLLFLYLRVSVVKLPVHSPSDVHHTSR